MAKECNKDKSRDADLELELDEETRLLREENERLREEIARVKSLPLKERLYDHVNVSLRTLDIFIGVMIAIGVIAVIVGMTK